MVISKMDEFIHKYKASENSGAFLFKWQTIKT